jgi:hypothetical protein
MYVGKIAQRFGGTCCSESCQSGQLTSPEILQHIAIAAECIALKVHVETLYVIHPTTEIFVQTENLFLHLNFYLRI